MYMSKVCTKCNKLKELSDFRKHCRSKDGYFVHCKSCERLYKKQYYANPEKRALGREARRKWRRSPAGKKYYKKYYKKIYNKNKVQIIRRTNKYNSTRDHGLWVKYNSINIRCNYPSQRSYRWYGAKGIKNMWTSYKHFKEDMYESYLQHLKKYGHKQTTLDRIDPAKHYCKENCRWATWKEQGNNRTNNVEK